MAEPRPSMVYVQPTTAETQAQAQAQPTAPKSPGWMEKGIRTAWTVLCFLVFCGFSFFLGWHLKGWHFTAYYDAPGNGSYLGAKPAGIHVPMEPDSQISQANGGSRNADSTH